jgi:hypothetical protein
MRLLGIMLCVWGAVFLFFSIGLREYGRRMAEPTGTVLEVGEDIRRRRGDEVAAKYYAEIPRIRASMSAKWSRVALCGSLMAITGATLLLAR